MKKVLFLLLCLIVLFFSACGSKKITVKFDSNGGPKIANIELEEAGKIEEPYEITREGYKFLGWYLDDKLFDFDNEITKSITLKAKWVAAVSVTLTSTGREDEIILVETNTTFKLPVIERVGFEFLGWYDCDTKEEITADYIFDTDLILEAKWKKKTQYAVYYYYNSQVIYTDNAYEGDSYTPYEPNMKGFVFNGYYSDINLTSEFDFSSLSRTNYIYLKFTPKTYTVTFEMSSKTVIASYSTRIGTLPTISISGCTFGGWEYEGKTITANTIYMYDEDITLKPILTTKSAFVVDDTPKVVTYKLGDATPYLNLVKSGMIFAGWYDNKDLTGDPIYVIDNAQYANKYLYAKWISSDDENNTYSKKIVELLDNYYVELYKDALVYENLDLRKVDSYYGANLTWTSSNKLALQDNGTITRAKENVNVVLTLTIEYNNITQTEEFNMVVKGNKYKDISKGAVVASYVYTGTYRNRPVDDILLDTVDIIYLAFTAPLDDGTLIVDNSYKNVLSEFYDKAIEKGVRVNMCVSGSHENADRLEVIVRDDVLRTNLVNNILDAIITYGFAGVDIDWEYPKESSKTYYTLLMKDIWETVKAYDPELLVTSAIPAGPWGYPKFDLKNSIQYLDYLNLMSYDMQCSSVGGKPYHHTALYSSSMTYSMCSIEETVNQFNKYQSVPLNKIIIGAGFYGRYSTVTALDGKITDNVVGSSMTYTRIYNDYLGKSTVTEYWDDKAKAPYAYDSASKIFISYDNPRSLQLKCDYVISKKVGGIMWWDYGSDATGTLIQAINEKLSTLKK